MSGGGEKEAVEGGGDQMSSVEQKKKNWIALEGVGETSLAHAQILISCGWPADCINIRLLFESCRREIWNVNVRRRSTNSPLPLTQTGTHDPRRGEPVFTFLTDTGHIWNRPLRRVSDVTEPKV